MSKKKEKTESQKIIDKFRKSKYMNFQKFLDRHPELFSHPKDDTINKDKKENKK